MIAILGLGLLIGMQHAFEADHVAAMASIATGEGSAKGMVRHGAVWGVGHTLTLILFGGLIMALGSQVPASLATGLEFGVGLMLIALGAHVFYRLYAERAHIHRHAHDGIEHVHVHTHAGEKARHQLLTHSHEHPKGLPLRTLFVGMTHGLAGSAALLMLTVASVNSAPLGLAYIAVFGIGSIVGMAVLSALLAVPLTYAGDFMKWGQGALRAGIGCATIVLGASVVYQSALQWGA